MKQKHLNKIEDRARLVDAASKLVWLDRPTAAAYIGIGTTHLDILIKRQSLPASRIGQRVSATTITLYRYSGTG